MHQWRPPMKQEIHKKLRDDFRRELKENYGFTDVESDPTLEVLFRSLAVQIEDVYRQAAESIPLAVLEELMQGLGMAVRGAQASQTVLRFSLKNGRKLFDQGAELVGVARSKAKFTFALDSQIEVSQAQICFAAIYENGLLGLHHGTGLSKEIEAARPSFPPVPADLGPYPAIFLAIDVEDPRHLSNHGLFFELAPEAQNLHTALQRETWCLLDDAGEVRLEGMLRSYRGNGGVRRLQWFADNAAAEKPIDDLLLPEGFYGGHVFLFPEITPERRFRTTIPRKMDEPVRRIFQAGGMDIFEKPRAWLRIALPEEANTVADNLLRIVLHCTTASNIEICNQTINFSDMGLSIPVRNRDGNARHLVKTISIKGEHGSEYVDDADGVADETSGRYRYRNDCLEFEPGRTNDGKLDRFANVRRLVTNGRLEGDDKVGPGAVTSFLNHITPASLEIRNITEAAGGTDSENYQQIRHSFNKRLLTRERILTSADLEAAIRAFEPRVHKIRSCPTLKRSSHGLCRAHMITLVLDRAAFTLPDEEAKILQQELQTHLQEQALLGLEIEVSIEWLKQ